MAVSDEPGYPEGALAFDGEPMAVPNRKGIYEHYCEHPDCSKWGSRGFMLRGQQAWFCFEHKEDGER
jgi:hypothetical protein